MTFKPVVRDFRRHIKVCTKIDAWDRHTKYDTVYHPGSYDTLDNGEPGRACPYCRASWVLSLDSMHDF